MEFVPLRFFSKPSAEVPAAARPASVFFTTWYLPPAACTARRSLVSSFTVMPWKVVRITVETFASSVFRLSRSCCFSLRFFMSSSLLRRRCQCFGLGQINGDARPHGRGQRDSLHVFALGRRRLRLNHCVDHRVTVFRQLGSVKLNLANRE